MPDGNKEVGTTADLYKGLGLEAPEGEKAPAEEPAQEPESSQEPQGEEPSVEPQNEQEPKAEEPQGEEPAEAPEGAKDEEPKPTVFEMVNQEFATEFKDADEFKSFLESPKRVGELEEQLKELESLKEENLLLKENLDPMKYFPSEDDYKIAQFKKQFPDKDAATAYRLFSTDLSQMSDKDVIAYEMMLETPGLSKDRAVAVIDHEYGIDGDEVDDVASARLTVNGNKARKAISALKGQITLPDKIDPTSLAQEQKELREQKAEALKQKWDGVSKKVVETFPEYKVSEKDKDGNEWAFNYSLTQGMDNSVVDQMVNYMAQSGTELTDDAVQQMGAALKKELLSRNIDDIVKKVREDTAAKYEEERLKKQHNPGEPKPDTEPKKGKGSDVNQQILSAMEGQRVRSNFLNK